MVDYSRVDSQVVLGHESRTLYIAQARIESFFRPISTTVGDWLFETESTLTKDVVGTIESRIVTRFSGVLELSAPTLVSLDFTATTMGRGAATFYFQNALSSSTSATFQGVLGPGNYAFELSGEIPDGPYTGIALQQGRGRVHMTTQAVPEPSTLAVLGLSSAVLAVRRRRRARL